jgi:hypothetical protein
MTWRLLSRQRRSLSTANFFSRFLPRDRRMAGVISTRNLGAQNPKPRVTDRADAGVDPPPTVHR